ncbi:MAG TPA: steroid 3-ketoacyl-CoA thiolase [Candidatus Dormibacteraeota bacterium]|nr:steroid 3-ketoacyl-CoA thiolase [Candidatus Dormibacteraeota bacterium]
MREVMILEAVRSPIGRRGGGLSGLHPADLLGAVQRATVERCGIDPGMVGQIIGGCVSQVGEQSFNVARTAWLAQGFPMEVAATTVDSQCGSSQQATSLAAGLIGAGIEDVVLACGVEMMTRVPLGANMKGGSPLPGSYREHYAYASQFQGAEMIAREYGLTREDTDRFGVRSQTLAAQAWREGRFEREVVPITAPVLDAENKPTGETRVVRRDEGLRETSMEKLATLKPVEPDGVHTAGTSSQVSDGAAAVLLASPERAQALGLRPRARIATTTLVGVDPVTMLKGPIPATRKVLAATGLRIDDIDEFEVNEAFASVVLAWMKDCGPNPERVNPNGGAIAIGHPTGCTGARLITTALHELERTKRRYALIAMCCGGGLGTGTIIERL